MSRGPTRPWSVRLEAEADHLDGLSNRWPRGLSLHAANCLTEAAAKIRQGAAVQREREQPERRRRLKDRAP